MGEDLIHKIKQEIEKSGHPVSINVSTILQNKGWFVKNSVRYPHGELDIGEADVIANTECKLVQNTFENLIIECKKQKDAPWVFFNQNWKNTDVLTLTHNRANNNNGMIYDWLEKNGIFKKHYYFNKKLATYYFVAFKKPDDGPAKTIDHAIKQVLRATAFYCSKYATTEAEHFFYPIIVLDGELFEVNYEQGEPNVQKSNHISLFYEFESDKIDFLQSYEGDKVYRWISSKPFVIDIVTLDYFGKFLENF